MFNKLRLKLIRLLLPINDIRLILISLGITEEEYKRRYNNPEHHGYKSEGLKNMRIELDKLQIQFALMLGIKDYDKYLDNRYKNKDVD